MKTIKLNKKEVESSLNSKKWRRPYMTKKKLEEREQEELLIKWNRFKLGFMLITWGIAMCIVMGTIQEVIKDIENIKTVDIIIPVKENLTVEEQIRKIAKEENFKWADYLVRLAKCESKLNPMATNSKGNNPSTSIDRGLFQYNSHWQSKVSDACAFDITCSTKTTIKMINEGKQNLWACNKLVLKN